MLNLAPSWALVIGEAQDPRQGPAWELSQFKPSAMALVQNEHVDPSPRSPEGGELANPDIKVDPSELCVTEAVTQLCRWLRQLAWLGPGVTVCVPDQSTAVRPLKLENSALLLW